VIRPGKQYVRRERPHTVVKVLKRKHGQVTYEMQHRVPESITISIASFKAMYRKVRK